MAAGPLFLPDHQPAIAGAGAFAADLDAERSAMRGRRDAHLQKARMATARISSGTGSAPTIRAAMSLPGCSMAFAFRSCSG